MTASEQPTLGVDIGGVIIARSGNQDTSFWGSRPMSTPEVVDAVDTLSALVPTFAGRVYLVSKAGLRVQRLTEEWLDHIGFWPRTGLRQTSLRFVRRRAEKAAVATQLGVSHFIDDRLDILETMPNVLYRYWFTGGTAPSPGAQSPRWARRLNTWPELRNDIDDTFDS